MKEIFKHKHLSISEFSANPKKELLCDYNFGQNLSEKLTWERLPITGKQGQALMRPATNTRHIFRETVITEIFFHLQLLPRIVLLYVDNIQYCCCHSTSCAVFGCISLLSEIITLQCSRYKVYDVLSLGVITIKDIGPQPWTDQGHQAAGLQTAGY